jgi:ribonucleotide reductase beta subunit family protein with ferritin-like domain
MKCEILWFKNLIYELGITNDDLISLWWSYNFVQHDRMKNIEIDRCFIKEKLNDMTICIPFVMSKNQLANMFTYGLVVSLFYFTW